MKENCSCNKERVIKALKLIEKEELKKIIQEDNGAEIVCNFCEKKYIFTKEELENLL